MLTNNCTLDSMIPCDSEDGAAGVVAGAAAAAEAVTAADDGGTMEAASRTARLKDVEGLGEDVLLFVWDVESDLVRLRPHGVAEPSAETGEAAGESLAATILASSWSCDS
ncbi:uncharacterized protein V6R79_007632 [Siganus canaliculatus]